MVRHTTLIDLLEQLRDKQKDDIAFIDGDKAITFEAFGRICDGATLWLRNQGIGPGDRVAVWLVNRIEWLALFFGLCSLGAILVTVNTRYKSHEVTYLLEKSEACLLVLEPSFRKIDFVSILKSVDASRLPKMRSLAFLNEQDTYPGLQEDWSVSTLSLDEEHDSASVDRQDRADAPCILFTTSGTTSSPKLVVHTQRTIAEHSQNVASAYQFTEPGAVLLAALPFCGVYGFNAVLASFTAGQPTVLMDTFDAQLAAELIRKHKVTHLFGSDEMYARLLDQVDGNHPFPSARVFGFAAFNAGFLQVGRQAWERNVPLYGLYGSSEVQALFSLQNRPMLVDERLKGGGFPANPDVQIRIRDLETGKLLETGQSGAIEIRADTNFAGYLNNPEATQKAVDDEGFFHTGDLGYLRDDGSFVYQARHGDAIRLAGFLVNPSEIEDVLKEQTGVRDAQVVGVEQNGQNRCVAFVISENGTGIDEVELRTRMQDCMAAFKVPVRIWKIDEFPTTLSSNGVKIQRNKLREMAIERLG